MILGGFIFSTMLESNGIADLSSFQLESYTHAKGPRSTQNLPNNAQTPRHESDTVRNRPPKSINGEISELKCMDCRTNHPFPTDRLMWKTEGGYFFNK